MYASKPDYHLGIVHAQHTIFFKTNNEHVTYINTAEKKKAMDGAKKGFNHTTINTHKPASK